MLIGYARKSSVVQDHALQLDALEAAGCERVVIETGSGTREDRPELARALEFAREGDTIVVWRLCRLARSLRQLIATVDDLQRRDIGLRSLTESIDTSSPSGRSPRWRVRWAWLRPPCIVPFRAGVISRIRRPLKMRPRGDPATPRPVPAPFICFAPDSVLYGDRPAR